MSEARDSFVSQLAARARTREAQARAYEGRTAGTPRDALRANILAALDAQASQAPRSPMGPIDPNAPGGRASEPAPISCRSLRTPARWKTAAFAIVPLAAAAAFALHLGHVAPFGAPEAGGAGDYVVAIAGHIETERAAGDRAASTLEARAGSIQDVVLRPRERVAMPVVARVLGVFGASIAPLDVPTEVTERGVVRFTARGDALRGASEVRVVIAPPAMIDAAVAQARTGAAAGERGVVVVRVAVDGAH